MINDDIFDEFIFRYFERSRAFDTNPKINQLQNAERVVFKKLTASFSPEQKNLMEEYETAMSNTRFEIERLIFRLGFRTSIQLLCSAFFKE